MLQHQNFRMILSDFHQLDHRSRYLSHRTTLLLARASTTEQESSIGRQTGGRVFLFLNTDDFWRDYHEMLSAGIKFVREPKEAEYGTVAVFEDLYGNLWDLLERKNQKAD